MDRSSLGELIRAARLRRGWTQDQLAKELGVERSYVSQWETGGRKWPQDYIRAIATALDLSQVEMAVAAGIIDDPNHFKAPPTYPDHRLKEIADMWLTLKPEVRQSIHAMFRDLVALPQTRLEDEEAPVIAVAR